jgi:hypothetical protein
MGAARAGWRCARRYDGEAGDVSKTRETDDSARDPGLEQRQTFAGVCQGHAGQGLTSCFAAASCAALLFASWLLGRD